MIVTNTLQLQTLPAVYGLGVEDSLLRQLNKALGLPSNADVC